MTDEGFRRRVAYDETPRRRARVRLAAAPHALLYLAGYLLLRPFVRIRLSSSAVLPPRSLVYGFHEILLLGILGSRHTRHITWVNNDTVGGVASAVPARVVGIRVFRLVVDGQVPQFRQLETFLNTTEDAVGILTDAGRRDRVIRSSLARIAVATNRPLVPVTITASRGKRIDGQVFPWPFATVTVDYGVPVDPGALAGVAPEQARALLARRLRTGPRAVVRGAQAGDDA